MLIVLYVWRWCAASPVKLKFAQHDYVRQASARYPQFPDLLPRLFALGHSVTLLAHATLSVLAREGQPRTQPRSPRQAKVGKARMLAHVCEGILPRLLHLEPLAFGAQATNFYGMTAIC